MTTTTYAIADDLSGVIATEDGFGIFPTEEAANDRLIEMLQAKQTEIEDKLIDALMIRTRLAGATLSRPSPDDPVVDGDARALTMRQEILFSRAADQADRLLQTLGLITLINGQVNGAVHVEMLRHTYQENARKLRAGRGGGQPLVFDRMAEADAMAQARIEAGRRGGPPSPAAMGGKIDAGSVETIPAGKLSAKLAVIAAALGHFNSRDPDSGEKRPLESDHILDLFADFYDVLFTFAASPPQLLDLTPRSVTAGEMPQPSGDGH